MAGGIDTYTKLMLHCNGSDESTTITDYSDSAHTVTVNGTAQVDTDITDSFGGNDGVLLLDGNSDYLSLDDNDDWDFGNNNFTIECWARWNSLSMPVGWQALFDQFFTSRSWALSIDADSLNFSYSIDGTNVITVDKSWTPSLNIWYHIAVVRNGSDLMIFVDGTQLGTTYNIGSSTIYNSTQKLWIGTSHTGSGGNTPDGFFNGWMNEIRISKGIARWTSNFTPPTNQYGEEYSVSVDETVVWNEANTEDITIIQAEEIIWNEQNTALLDLYTSVDETVVWNEDNTLDLLTNLNISSDETVVWNEDNSEDITIQDDNIVIWNETGSAIVPQGTANKGIEIISINPLVFVSYTSPAKITKVDVTVPASITWSAVEIVGLDYATSCVYNDITGYVYISGDSGKVAKIELNDLSNQTIINTNDTDNLQVIDSLDAYFRTYISTDDSSGEVIVIDERTMNTLNTDLRCIQRIDTVINTRIDTIEGSLIDTDLRCIAQNTSTIACDLRCIAYEYSSISQHPINYSDIIVKINGTDLAPLNDVRLSSINIIHTIDDRTTATFQLNRRHDKLDYDNQGNSSQITNNNAVIIEVDGHEEFNGKISRLTMDSQNEIVNVIAEMDQPSSLKNSILLPKASVGDNIHLYQCLLSDPDIENPYLDTRQVIQGSNGQWWTGSAWTRTLTSALTFVTYALAESYINAITDTNTLFWDKNPKVANYEQKTIYKGITVDLGTEIQQNILRYSYVGDTSSLATKAEDGTFEPKQNWIYFWLAKAENFITGRIWGTLRYIGTSYGSLHTDAFKINGLSYKYQKINEDTETDLGSYQAGSAPYNSISPKNGRKKTVERWEDKNDGLYVTKDASYDYEQYAKDIADLEYEKLQNINGDVLPLTSCTIDISIDAYYYYGVKLLSRINIDNTTTTDIYKNNNGFPVAVKSIIMSFNDSVNGFKVSLQCDNTKSQEELEDIDANYPDINSDEYVIDEASVKRYSKFDPVKWEYPA